jgi:hypothetical protein
VFDACIDIRIPKGYGPHHGCYHMKRRCRWDFAKWSKWSQLKRKALADMNVIQEKFKEYYEHRLFMSSHFEGNKQLNKHGYLVVPVTSHFNGCCLDKIKLRENVFNVLTFLLNISFRNYT